MLIKKIKLKFIKSKYLKKVSCITLASALVFNTMGGTISAFAEEIQSKSPRSLNVRQDGSPMSFVGDRHGNFLTFPKLRMSDGRFAYCMEHNKPTPNPSGVNYSEGRELDNGVKYILEYEPNTGSADKDYYIKGGALKYYLGDIQWIKYAVTGTDIRDHILNLVAQAKGTTLRKLINEDSNIEILNEDQDSIDIKEKNANVKTINEEVSSNDSSNEVVEIHKMNIGKEKAMPRSSVSITASPRTQDFKIVGDNYETDWYHVSIQGDLTSYRMDIKGQPNGTQIINQNGQAVTSLSKNDTKFKLRVPKANVNGNFTVKMLLQGQFVSNVAKEYLPSNSTYQKVATLVNRPTNAQDYDLLTANLIGNGGLEVIKKSENGNVLQGAGFKLMKNGADVRGIQETDGNGRTVFNDLAPGQYDLVEVKAPTGHVISHANTKVTVNAGTTSTIEVSNEVIKGKVQVLKVDEETGQPLKGAEFDLKNKATGKVVEKLVTGEDGKALSGLHPFGEYVLQETKAPNKYVLNGKEYFATISEHMKTIEVTAKNRIIKGKIAVEKSDSEINDLKLKGVEFEISNEKGKVVDKLVTDEKGKAVSKDLNIGKYFLKETKTLQSHILNPKVYEVNITEDGKVYTYDIKNDVKKGKVEVIKIDDTKLFDRPLKGAEFSIYDKNGKIVDTLVTDQQGYAISKYLRYGSYTMKETKAPEGYKLSDKIYEIEIKNDKQIVKFEIGNTIKKGKVEVIKLDSELKEDLPLAGAEFTILDLHRNQVDKLVTDQDGKAISKDIEYGRYIMQETKAPEGYKPSNKIYRIEIKDDKQVVKFKIENEIKKGKVEVVKTDSELKEDLPLAGAEFTILDLHRNQVDKLVTNQDGKAISKELRYGRYIMQETKAPEGYKPSDTIYQININGDGQIVKFDIENNIKKGKVEVVKTDSETKRKLKGTEFTIYDLHRNIVDKIITNEEGYAVSKDLRHGRYIMQETKATTGYIPSDKIYEIEIKEDGQVIKFDITNDVKKGEVDFSKIDVSTGKTIEGAKIEIVGVSETNNHVKIEFTSSKEGNKFTVPHGKYEIREKIAPNGYVLTDEVGTFEIKENGEVVKAELKNKPILGKLRIVKVDGVTKKKLEGAEFVIRDSSNKEVQKIVTDKQGYATSKELRVGEYTYQETKAPKGYLKDDNVYKFTISENGKVIEKEMKNYTSSSWKDTLNPKNWNKVTNPQTGDTGGILIAAVLAIGAFTGLLAINVISKKKDN